MMGFAAHAVPETGPLMTTPALSLAPGWAAYMQAVLAEGQNPSRLCPIGGNFMES